MSEPAYGIDLGTTYSAIARIGDLGGTEIIKNFEGDDTTPSAVYFEGPGAAIVGTEAKRVAPTAPDNACLLIKRHMGTEYPQEFQGESYTPEAISSMIIKELVNAANNQTGRSITKVVITVPAYFGVKERESTRQAGQMAGVDVIGIVTEPVAAALSIGARSDKDETILVYDLGGGTFDTTIMQISNGSVKVISVDGNRELGGADWDSVLFDLVVEKFIESAELGDDDPRYDEDFALDLRLEIETLKKTLSRRESANVRVAYEGEKATIEVTRDEFEQATRHLILQTIEISERALSTALEKDSSIVIDRVLLVGGSSRMPMVKESLKEHLGWDAQDTEFDLAVAKGAAIYGQAAVDEVLATGDEESTPEISDDAPTRAFFPGGAAKLDIVNVLSRGIGCGLVREEDHDEHFVRFLVHANDQIPCSAEPVKASAITDGQTTVKVTMYEQGGEQESDALEDNDLLKETTLELPEPIDRGDPIDVTLEVSSEGLATMVVTDATSGKSVQLEAMLSVLSKEQVAEETAKVSAMALRS